MLNVLKPVALLRAAVLGLAAGTLLACGGGGAESASTATTSTPTAVATAPVTYVSGIVKNSAGNPIAGASVLAAGETTTTGADGSYKFDASSAGDNIVVLVRKSGFTTTAKEVPLVAASTTQMDIQLFADQVSTTFDAATAANVSVNGAAVQIPANAIQTANGAAYTGTVSLGASYYSPDTVQGVQAFAGPYAGTDAGTQSPIVSMGFMEVKLTDVAGSPLQLKAPATLTFPASSNAANAASIPLWFYDESAKIWKREGQANRQADGTYQGSVAHFTIWNVDFKGVTATIKGCFRDAAGQALSNVGFAGLRTTGWSQTLFLRDATGTAPGDFTILNVPADRPLELYSANAPATFGPLAIAALLPGEIRTLSGCITATAVNPSTLGVITLPAGLFTVTTPIVTPTTPPVTGTAVFAGNYSGTYGGAEIGTFAVTISSSGVVTGSTFSQTFSQSFPVTGRITSSGSVSLTASGSAGSAQFSGTVNAAGSLTGNWNYVQSTLGGTFTGQRQ